MTPDRVGAGLLARAGALARVLPLNAQPLSHLLAGQSAYPDHFIPAGLAGGNSNGGTRHLQKFRKEIDTGFVRLAVNRRGGKRNLECIADFTGEGVLLCPWMDLHGECGPGW